MRAGVLCIQAPAGDDRIGLPVAGVVLDCHVAGGAACGSALRGGGVGC